MLALSILTEADTIITFVILKGSQQFSVGMFEALNSAHIADKVFAFVAFDCSPLFVGEIGNVIYKITSFLLCLSMRFRNA